MAGVKVSVLLVATAMCCAGCSLFYGNLFAGLDKPPAPKAADYEGTNGLDKLATDLDSPAVVALLTTDPTTVAQIQAYLATFDLTNPQNANDQMAAALSADLALKTTQGDDLVSNAVTSIMNNPPSGNLADLIKSVTPPDVIADKTDDTAFVAMVDALLAAKVLYDNLGASIHTLGKAPQGMNLGDVAQKAAGAYVMYFVVVTTLEAMPYSYTQAQAETLMFDLATDQATTSIDITTDPFNPMPTNLGYIFDAAVRAVPRMKRIAAAAAFLLVIAANAAAADFAEIPFVPLSPEVMGRGGSFIADTRGYDSFFFNPAGFSRDGGSFTLTSASTWIYSRADALINLGGQLLGGTATPASEITFMNSQVTTGGLGAGAQWGIGYVGNGLGLGAMVIMDSLLSGQTLLGMTGDVTGTIGFIGGLSYPFELGGIKIHVGGDVRPMIRIHVPLDNSSSLALLNALANGQSATAALSSANALYGVGIGLDVGTIAEIGWFTLGLSVRDLAGTQFRYAESTFGAVSTTFGSQMRFPTGSPVTSDTYTIPMDIAFGVGFHPDFGNFNGVFDPSMSVDINDLVGLFAGDRSVWTLLHAGAQLRILSLFSVSAGINQGYLTAGFGLKLFFLDITAALFTRELGTRAGDKPNAGASLDVSIRW